MPTIARHTSALGATCKGATKTEKKKETKQECRTHSDFRIIKTGTIVCLGCKNGLFLQVGASFLLFMEEAEKQGKKVGDQGVEQVFDLKSSY